MSVYLQQMAAEKANFAWINKDNFLILAEHVSSGASCKWFLQISSEWCLSVSLVNTFMLSSRVLQGVMSCDFSGCFLIPQPVTGLNQRKCLSIIGPSMCWPVCIFSVGQYGSSLSLVLIYNIQLMPYITAFKSKQCFQITGISESNLSTVTFTLLHGRFPVVFLWLFRCKRKKKRFLRRYN